MPRNKTRRRCTATTAAGKPCRSWAMGGSNPPRCNVHQPGRWQHNSARRCSARTKAGKRCRNAAIRGRRLCCFHAGLNVPGRAQRRAGRVCTARTTKGQPCRKWAVPGSDPPRCNVHGPQKIWSRRPPPHQRCTARTKQGRRCRAWAARHAPSGQALCSTHGHLLRRPQAHERCTAANAEGEPCAGWAVHGSKEQYGAGLCPAHLPQGDPRRIRGGLPDDDEHRCRAITLQGRRCPHWAMSTAGAKGLCWLHAFPHLHPRITHGYYRKVPTFSPAMQAAILRIAGEQGPLSGELILVRLKLRDVNAYMYHNDLPHDEMTRVANVILHGVRAVLRLVQAQHTLANINWGPYSAGGTGFMLQHMRRQHKEAPHT